MTDRRWIAGLAVVLVALIAVGIAAIRSDPSPPPEGARTPKVHQPSSRLPKPAPATVRASLPAPAGIEPPEIRGERPEPAAITGEDRLLMNTAVDEVLRAARIECLAPWVTQQGDGDPAEFVFDAVLHDGRLVDIGLRSMRLDLPSEVVQCVADRAWYADWPEWDLHGELRLQRSIDVAPIGPGG